MFLRENSDSHQSLRWPSNCITSDTLTHNPLSKRQLFFYGPVFGFMYEASCFPLFLVFVS